MSRHAVNALASRSRGFTLIEIVVVIVILAILISMAAALTRGVAAAQKRTLSVTRLAAADAALAQFVTHQKRLPCPADGALASGNANAGVETARDATGCTTNQQNGVIPWRALGLTEADATDAWDRRLTYRVFPALAADNAMNMSWCDPAGTAAAGALPNVCNIACVSTNLALCTSPANFLFARGLEVRSVSGTVVMNPNPAAGTPHTGAAYILVSAGESGGGAYLGSGTLGTSTTGDGTEEAKNYASLPYAGVATYYVDDSIAEVAGANHFDDLVSRPSLLSVISKAGLGPRSH